MTFKEWIDSKGLDAVNEELRELTEPMADGPITVTNDCDGDEMIVFYFNFEDGSYMNQELFFDDEVPEVFDSVALLKTIASALWENYIDFPESEFNSYQNSFMMKLNQWEQQRL